VVVVIFAHVSSLSDEDIAREDANLFCRLLLFLGIVVIDTDDVNDEDEEEEKDEHICLERG
jgi:hypothetical protein|tara:strand:+ start:360 stop:542 length:183 start_codon:yes stop_codon:yes gene_type:complete